MSGREWRHGAVSTPIITAGAVYGGGLAANLTGAPPGLLGLGGAAAAGTLASAVAAWGRGMRRCQAAYTVGCTAATGAWLAGAAAGDPFGWTGTAAFGIPAVALGTLYPLFRWSRRDVIAAAHAAERAADTTADAGEWGEIIARAGFAGVREIGRKETRAGFTVLLALPDSGRVTARSLALPAALQRIAVAAKTGYRLRDGALQVEQGEYAGEAVLHVSTRDVLAETIPLPDEHEPLTITRPFPIGEYEDGERAELLLRQNAVLIVGKRGEGKSSLLHTILANVTRCVDAVVWVVDMGGGATVRPWIEPWLDGQEGCDRPVIDWVATTPEEAVRVLQAAVAIIDGRSTRVRGKHHPTPDEPALVLVMDELPKLMTLVPRAAVLLERILKEGRKACLEPVVVMQRGTVQNTGGGEAKSQFDTRIGLRTAPGETQYVFPGVVGVDLSKLRHRGSMIVQDRDERLLRAKSYFTNDEDDTIAGLVVARTHTRPALDARTAHDAGKDYAQRWSRERTAALVGGGSGDGPPPPAQPPAARPSVMAEPSYRRPPSPEDFLASRGLAPGPDPLDRPVTRPDEIDQEYAELVAAAAEPRAGRAEPKDRVWELLRAAGDDGLGATRIAAVLEAEGYPTTRQTVSDWLRAAVAEGFVDQPARGRYVWRGQ